MDSVQSKEQKKNIDTLSFLHAFSGSGVSTPIYLSFPFSRRVGRKAYDTRSAASEFQETQLAKTRNSEVKNE